MKDGNNKPTDKSYAPPLRSVARVGNTTFTVNSYFPEQAADV